VLTLAALGIVFGDIGTSPLYALRECFHGPHALAVTSQNILGILSLVVWSLIVVISLKYVLYVMKADNRGEGGVLSLMALVTSKKKRRSKKATLTFIYMGLLGAALLYGDGMITPAISVLGAVGGLKNDTPFFEPYVVPITMTILILVFLPQRRGTARIGKVFGPVILVWFIAISLTGIRGIMMHPTVLWAMNPLYALDFFLANKWHAFLSLGAVILCITGGEALYADMGHFGRRPIRHAWFYVVLPALLLNYFGQGALLIEDPESAVNPFFHLVPEFALYPMVIIATLAAVIASQALISGAFSITRQAIQLGYLPRMTILHTSQDEIGQIYVPFVNWVLLASTLWLVVTFQTSSNLAAAYGIAVTTTMVLTTLLTSCVAKEQWRWNVFLAGSVSFVFLLVDLSFWGASILKIKDGGWFPLAIGAVILMLMVTWRKGREILARRLKEKTVPLDDFIDGVGKSNPTRVPGVAIFLTSNLHGTPPALAHNLKHNRVLHEKVIILMIKTLEVPHVSSDEQILFEKTKHGFYNVTAYYGYMDSPNVPGLLLKCKQPELQFLLSEITYFLGRETLIASKKPGMALWRERLFAVMSLNAQRATSYFKIPPNQVVEIGIQIEL